MTAPINIFDTASAFVHQTNRSVFLTGKAGTGKTTFLKHIKTTTTKNTVVVAPTGVAAINAGGVTIHSFFQLPFAPFIPVKFFGDVQSEQGLNDSNSLLSRIKVQREKRKLFQELELLIIDEVSMVRCDVLDAIDTVLRHFRSRYAEPFGGVQVLLIGDLYQLPPVIPDAEWQLLQQHYQTPYFFSSQVVANYPLLYIELDKVYRQKDDQFIGLLHQVRNNQLDEAGYTLLHSRYQPDFVPAKADNYITLTTHNIQAQRINEDALAALPGKLFSLAAQISGDFSDKAFPAEERLQLKIGAQVMFIKNDTEKIRRFFNGKIGIVTAIDEDAVTVTCKEEEPIKVNKHTWENIRYLVNKQTNAIEEEVMGSFEQFPLRLAWAITIHKSQGLTFDKAVIDAGSAFAPGQVYVALSRCTSLNGLVLLSRITSQSLRADDRIVQFAASYQQHTLADELAIAEADYFKHLLLSLFQFSDETKTVQELESFITEHAASFNDETQLWLSNVAGQLATLQQVANSFQPHILALLQQDIAQLQQRVKDAARYFHDKISALLSLLESCPAVTDSKQLAEEANESLNSLLENMALKHHLFVNTLNGCSVAQFNAAKQSFIIPKTKINVYALANHYQRLDVPHPLLYKQLKSLRDSLAEEHKLPIYLVAGSQSLEELVRYLPQTKTELLQITGFGKAKAEQFGDSFLTIIQLYSSQNNLTSLIKEKKPKKERKEKAITPKADTKQLSYNLYKEGKTIAEIAAQRNLVPSTVEGHLAHYVAHGVIAASALVSEAKIKLVQQLLQKEGELSPAAIKEKLGDQISYSEIKIIMAGEQSQ